MWKTVGERPNYSVSDDGKVRNDKTGRILKQHKGTCGYMQVQLGHGTSPLYVHRLVARAYIPNDEELPQVDHVNGDKADNRAENLRWVTASENCWGHGYSERREHRKKTIVATNGDATMVFGSRNEAAEYFGCSKGNIRYGHLYKKGNKRGWVLDLAEDIV